MRIKGSSLYLYLALVCFLGIIAIFITDGYLGLYDVVYITSQEREQKIEPDYWNRPWAEDGYAVGVRWKEPVYFKYEVENRSFSTYSTDMEVSIWKSGKRITVLAEENLLIGSFDKVTVDWVLQADELALEDINDDRYTLKIMHGEIERKILLGFHPSLYPPKPPEVRTLER